MQADAAPPGPTVSVTASGAAAAFTSDTPPAAVPTPLSAASAFTDAESDGDATPCDASIGAAAVPPIAATPHGAAASVCVAGGAIGRRAGEGVDGHGSGSACDDATVVSATGTTGMGTAGDATVAVDASKPGPHSHAPPTPPPPPSSPSLPRPQGCPRTGQSPGTATGAAFPVTESGVPLAALAHAKAAAELRQDDAKERRRRMQQQKRRDEAVARRVARWQRLVQSWGGSSPSMGVKKLCMEGIPPSVRPKAWPVMLGNALNVTGDLVKIFKAQASQVLQRLHHDASAGADTTALSAPAVSAGSGGSGSSASRAPSSPSGDGTGAGSGGAGAPAVDGAASVARPVLGREASLLLIDVDLPRTFPSLAFFHGDGPLAAPLRQMLQTYVCFRPDVGYVQGMSYLAAMVLLVVDSEAQAFTCFANLLARHVSFDLYRLKAPLLHAYVRAFEALCHDTQPVLLAHLTAHGVQPDMYLFEWFITLFSKALPLDVAFRVWDVYLVEGEAFLFRVALGVLRMLEPVLVAEEMEGILRTLQRLPPDLDVDVLFANVAAVPVPAKRLAKLLDTHRRDSSPSPTPTTPAGGMKSPLGASGLLKRLVSGWRRK